MHTIVTATARVWLGDDDVIHLRPHARREQTLADAIENVAAVEEVGGGVRRPLMIHFQSAAAQTPECRSYYMSETAARSVLAVAIVTSSTLGRIVGNLMIGINGTSAPVRLFDDDESALAWLTTTFLTPISLRNRPELR